MILDRYLVKEVVPNVFIGLLVFTFVMLMNQIVILAEILITHGVEFWMIFLIIFYSLPALTVLTIPMSMLLGILLSLGRLQADSELTVMRASGISFFRIMIPIMSLGVVCWGICAYLMMVSVPWGNYSLSRLMYQILTTNTARDLKPRVFYNQFPNMILYVQDIPSKENTWKGVMIYDESQPDKARMILAQEGVVHQKGDRGAMELELKNGSWHEVDPGRPEDYSFAYFLQNVFQLSNPQNFSADIPKGDREQTIPELKAKIKEYRNEGLPTRFLEVEVHKKYSIPFACMIFSFLAVSLGVSSKKGTRSSAYAISIGIILIYYIFLIGGERLGDAGRVTPFTAAWAGNIVLGIAGILLFLQSNSSAISKLWQKIVNWKQPSALYPMVAKPSPKKHVRVVLKIRRLPWRLFTLLDRYIVREFIKNFLLILVALVLIAELIEATQLVDDLFAHKLPYSILFDYLKFHFPQWVFYVLPVTALTTTLVTFGLMTKNSEIIAMKSSGVSLYRISIPIIIVASILSVLAFWLQDYILPYTEKIAHNLHRQIKGQPPETYSTFERHWISGSDGFFNYELFNVRKNIMYGFSIYQVDLQNFNLLKRIYAREATYSKGHWVLRHGWQRTFENGRVQYQPFNQQQAKLPVNPEYFKTEQELPAEMKFAELKRYIQKMKERGFDFVRFAVDLQAKVSFPTVSLILTLIAIPFSFATGKRGALYGIGLSIVMGIVFWFFLALTKSLGYLEILNPFLAAWTPNILATLLALYLLFKIRT
jgi:LPS export ABC transporter permease LptG/LPS export ABC transporter permease LptF